METLGFIEKVKGFIINPIETFQQVKEEPLGDGLRYYVPLLILQSLLNVLIITVLAGTLGGNIFSVYESLPGFAMGGSVFMVLLFTLFVVGGLIGVFIGGGIIHLGVLMFGGKRGYIETVKAVIYGGTPSLLFGWLPFIGIVFGLWAFVLEIFGIRELQEMSTGRAVAAVLVPIIIIGVIVTIIVALIVYLYVTSMMMGF